jgi:hypothetical protein
MYVHMCTSPAPPERPTTPRLTSLMHRDPCVHSPILTFYKLTVILSYASNRERASMSAKDGDTGSYISPEAREAVNRGLMDQVTIQQLLSSGHAAKEKRAAAMEKRRRAADAQARANGESSGSSGAKESGAEREPSMESKCLPSIPPFPPFSSRFAAPMPLRLSHRRSSPTRCSRRSRPPSYPGQRR